MHLRLYLSAVLLAIGSLLAKGQADDGMLTVRFSDIPLSEAISAVESASRYTFLYDAAGLDLSVKVSLSAENTPINEALDMMLSPVSVGYEINGRQIALYPVSGGDNDGYIVITGEVLDVDNEPIVGVAVFSDQTTHGVTTGLDGKFSIRLSPDEHTLTFSCLGYVDKTVNVSGKKANLKIYLSEDAISLDATIVVGYGTQKKVNLTGAISTVESSDLQDRVSSSLTHMLQGNVPGLNVTTSSGRPGTSASINLRGLNSINGGSPLVRILVTTKSGAESDGRPTVKYSGRFGWTEPTTSTDFETRGYYSVYLNDMFYKTYAGVNYSKYTEEDMYQLWIRRNDVVQNPERPWVMIDQRDGRDTYVYYANTDWYHYIYRDTHPTMSHNISFNGGTDRV